MASKSSTSSFSKWGLLEAAGITEDLLLTILANSTKASDVCYELTTGPTRGILIELYHFASITASILATTKTKSSPEITSRNTVSKV